MSLTQSQQKQFIDAVTEFAGEVFDMAGCLAAELDIDDVQQLAFNIGQCQARPRFAIDGLTEMPTIRIIAAGVCWPDIRFNG